MGDQVYESQYPTDKDLKPGTYRIFNTLAGTAIQISDHDPTKIVTWKQHSGKNQQWFLQRSGHGYQLQNRLHDVYLAVSNLDNHGLVYASRYPTTWVFLTFNGNNIIQLADRNRVLDLHLGLGHNGNEVHIWNLDGTCIPHRVWTLDRLSDDFEAETQEEIANKSKKLSEFQDELSSTRQELSEFRSILHQYNKTVHQLQQDLKSPTCYLSFPLGSPKTYDYTIIAIALVFALLSLPLYRFLRRLFWRIRYAFSAPVAR